MRDDEIKNEILTESLEVQEDLLESPDGLAQLEEEGEDLPVGRDGAVGQHHVARPLCAVAQTEQAQRVVWGEGRSRVVGVLQLLGIPQHEAHVGGEGILVIEAGNNNTYSGFKINSSFQQQTFLTFDPKVEDRRAFSTILLSVDGLTTSVGTTASLISRNRELDSWWANSPSWKSR